MAGIYIHIPFCRKACIYCDFHFSTNLKSKPELVDAICRELVLRKDYLGNETIETIYFGGGTPSVLDESELRKILDAVSEKFSVNKDAEITLEANPDDLDKGKLAGLKSTGINRLSVGLQSFIEEELKWMNRSHTAQQSEVCVKEAQDAGFENITVDLIYGSKFQSINNWQTNLQKVFDLNVPHISAYNLTIEERTVLGVHYKKGQERAIDDAFSMQCFELLINETAKKGFVHYEISNFGKEDFLSRHNTSYWKGAKYLGLGPSAHSYDVNSRQWNVSNNNIYIASLNKNELPGEREELTKRDKYNEYILTRLRTMWGVDLKFIKENFGEDQANNFEQLVAPYIVKGDVVRDNNIYTLSKEGKFIADKISSDLFI